jgi:hypothetical protein
MSNTFEHELEIYLRLRDFYRSAIPADDPSKKESRRIIKALVDITQDLMAEGVKTPMILFNGSLNFGMFEMSTDSKYGSDVDLIYAGKIYTETKIKLVLDLNKRLNEKLCVTLPEIWVPQEARQRINVSCVYKFDIDELIHARTYIDVGEYTQDNIFTLGLFYKLTRFCAAVNNESATQAAMIKAIADRNVLLRQELSKPYFRPLASEISVSFQKYNARLQDRKIPIPTIVMNDLESLFSLYI